MGSEGCLNPHFRVLSLALHQSVSECNNYEYEGEIWTTEMDDGNNDMQKSIDIIRPYLNQDPTDPAIHDTVVNLFNVTREYKHLMTKE